MTASERLKVQVWIHAVDAKGSRKVLILKTRPDRGGFWQPVTGGVEEGETLDAAAAREAAEETGLSFKAAPRALGFEFSFKSQYGPAREHVYEAEAQSPAAVKLDPKEHVESRWVDPGEVVALLKFETNARPFDLLLRKWKGKKGS
jgi:lipoyl(octanoyl) transferase